MKKTKKTVGRDQPLKVFIKNEVLTISIGVKTLAWCAENPPDDTDFDNDVKIVSARGFAKDVAIELLDEEEDGTTPVHLMFDKVIENAINQGSEHVELLDEEEDDE